MKTIDTSKILAQLWPDPMPPGMQVYAILDAARNDKIHPAVTACSLEWTCLYLGNIPLELEQVAPYLVKLERDNPFTKRIVDEGWADHWGIFFWSPAEMADLRQHFRKFLVVKDESGKDLVFRYYDPRVFRAYLPTCTPEELDTIFGPVYEFTLSDRDPSGILRFRVEQGQLVKESTLR
jgi:hypothetical protein